VVRQTQAFGGGLGTPGAAGNFPFASVSKRRRAGGYERHAGRRFRGAGGIPAAGAEVFADDEAAALPAFARPDLPSRVPRADSGTVQAASFGLRVRSGLSRGDSPKGRHFSAPINVVHGAARRPREHVFRARTGRGRGKGRVAGGRQARAAEYAGGPPVLFPPGYENMRRAAPPPRGPRTRGTPFLSWSVQGGLPRRPASAPKGRKVDTEKGRFGHAELEQGAAAARPSSCRRGMHLGRYRWNAIRVGRAFSRKRHFFRRARAFRSFGAGLQLCQPAAEVLAQGCRRRR